MNDQFTPSSLSRTMRWGLIAGAITLSVCIIGLIESFDARDVISEQLTLGQILLFSAAPIVGFFMARSEKDLPLKFVYGMISAALVAVPLALLVWLTGVFDGVSDMTAVSETIIERQDAIIRFALTFLIVGLVGVPILLIMAQSRKTPSRKLLYTLISCALAIAPISLLVWLTRTLNGANDKGFEVRDAFLNVSPTLIEIVTLGQENVWGGIGRLTLIFAGLGFFGVLFAFSPKRLRTALLTGFGWAAMIGTLSEVFIGILRSRLEDDTMDMVFGKTGINLWPFVIIGVSIMLFNLLLSFAGKKLKSAMWSGLIWTIIVELLLSFVVITLFQDRLQAIPEEISQDSTLWVTIIIASLRSLFLFILFSLLSWLWRNNWRLSSGGGQEKPIKSHNRSMLGKVLFSQRSTNYKALSLLGLLMLILPSILGVYLSEIFNNVGLYILMGLGLNIAVGLAGLLDLGYVTNFAVGAYLMALLTSASDYGLENPISFWLALPICVAAAMLTGFIFALPVLRMRGDYLAIATMGFGEIIRVLARSDALKTYIGGAQGILKVPKAQITGPIGGAIETVTTPINNFLANYDLGILSAENREVIFGKPPQLYYLIVLACFLMLFVSYRLNNSRVGRKWMAIREDEDVAAAMGINTVNAKVIAFTLSAASGGLAGAIFAAKIGSIYPHSFQLLISINVLSLIIVGGIGSIPGVVVGAFALIGVPELLREFAEFRILFYGIALIAMMLVRPEGLWPSDVRRRELRDADDETIPIPGD